ncbi:MAG: YigZ family protein [Planctomycetota bacterium]|jgi:uncharacterized YigZ family protein|nr:YigZ family protein [Planctomycetota bacterium]
MTIYRPAKQGYGEHEDRGSRFLAVVFHCESEEIFTQRLYELQAEHPKAGHHCWAYKIGDIYRFNDDGEPGGTAGRPMLQVLDGSKMSDVAAICIRYWGGTKLGTGGLARAYSGATRLAIEDAGLFEVIQRITFDIEIPFELMGLRSELEAKCGSIKFDGDFGARGWRGQISLDAGADVDVFNKLITDKGGGRIQK